MKKFTVDRIEENKTVLECENGKFVSIETKSLPKNVKEGDILRFEENSYFLDKSETEKRKKQIKDLMNSLFEE